MSKKQRPPRLRELGSDIRLAGEEAVEVEAAFTSPPEPRRKRAKREYGAGEQKAE